MLCYAGVIYLLTQCHGSSMNRDAGIMMFRLHKQVAAVMTAITHIADKAQISPSYSPVGADVHHHLLHGFLGPCEPAILQAAS